MSGTNPIALQRHAESKREIRTAPLYASAYPKRQWKDGRACLTHAVEFNAEGEAIRALCRKVQPESVHSDRTLHTNDEPTCKACASRWRKLREDAR